MPIVPYNRTFEEDVQGASYLVCQGIVKRKNTFDLFSFLMEDFKCVTWWLVLKFKTGGWLFLQIRVFRGYF